MKWPFHFRFSYVEYIPLITQRHQRITIQEVPQQSIQSYYRHCSSDADKGWLSFFSCVKQQHDTHISGFTLCMSMMMSYVSYNHYKMNSEIVLTVIILFDRCILDLKTLLVMKWDLHSGVCYIVRPV